MTDELQTKEYLKKLEHLKLADSSRLRMREDLLAHARFHAVSESPTPKAVPSPFFNFFMRPASVAFAMVLLVGTTTFYLNKDKTTELAVVDDTNQPTEKGSTTTEDSDTAPADSKKGSETQVPTLATNTPVPDSQTDSSVAMNSRAKSAPSPEAASSDMASDEAVMTTMLSQDEINIEDYRTDIVLREKTYRALITKHEKEIGGDNTTELINRLNTIATILKDAERKEDTEARVLLDKAMTYVGEVESTLSLLGTVTVEEGVIIKIDF